MAAKRLHSRSAFSKVCSICFFMGGTLLFLSTALFLARFVGKGRIEIRLLSNTGDRVSLSSARIVGVSLVSRNIGRSMLRNGRSVGFLHLIEGSQNYVRASKLSW